jgi:hypothetical protein
MLCFSCCADDALAEKHADVAAMNRAPQEVARM